MNWRVRPGDPNPVGIGRGELHHVAQLVTPQPVARRNEHRIPPPRLHAFERHHLVAVAELVIGAVIEHQQHVVARRIVGDGKKSLRGVVSLHVVHPRRRDQFAERRTVGFEPHASVSEQFQMRPYLAQVAAPRVLHHAAQQRQVPRRDTGEGRHPLRCALAADAFDLLVEIGQQCRLAARRAEPAAPKRSSLDQQRRQVRLNDDSAALRTGAPERQGLPLEYPCRGILPHVEGRHVAQPPRVAAPQRDVGDGQVFAPLGGRARRTGEPPHPAGRRDIGLARHHPLDVGFERRVIEPLHPLRERFGRADLPETVPSSELGSCAFAQQPFEFFALRLGGTTPEPFDRTAAQREKSP